MSKTQASTTASGKPKASPTTTKVSVTSGRWSPCMTGSTTWSSANETMP